MSELLHKYRQWLQQLELSLQSHLDPAVRPVVEVADTLAAYLQAGRDLTAYESQLFIETFFRQQQQSQPPSIWPETL